MRSISVIFCIGKLVEDKLSQNQLLVSCSILLKATSKKCMILMSLLGHITAISFNTTLITAIKVWKKIKVVWLKVNWKIPWLGLQFVKTKQTQPSLKANHFHLMTKFMQEFTYLDSSYFCTWFSRPESNNGREIPFSFLANNLCGEHRTVEMRKKIGRCPQTDGMFQILGFFRSDHVLHINSLR